MGPAYTSPTNVEDTVVMAVVCRNGFKRDMANMLLGDIKNAIEEFEQYEYPTNARINKDKLKHKKAFNHTGK